MTMNLNRARTLAYMLAASFLAIHVLLIIVFLQCQVTPMVYFNIFSICFYIFSLFAVKMGWFQFFTISVYLEVAVHMTLSVLLTGWENGFQITIIGMTVLIFYADHVGRSLKLRHISVMPFAIAGMLMYLGSCVYAHLHPPVYTLPGNAGFLFSLLWGIIVFIVIIFILQIFVLVDDSAQKKLEYQMSHDKLTGLPNRYYMSRQLKSIRESGGSKRYWIAIADVDDFKKINDLHGHNCGDYVLETLAGLFGTDETVQCCRWGGEEFLFIGSAEDGGEKGYELLESIRKRILEYPFRYDDKTFSVTMTFGMSTFPAGEGSDAALSEADARLYTGKNSGKNKVVWK